MARTGKNMEDRIENLDWIKERAACSLALVFERLKTEIKADVDERNAIRPERAGYKFVVDAKGNVIIVAAESNRPYIAVKFELFDNAIVVKDKSEAVKIEATLTLNDRGECKLRVKGQEREFWQFRREALEHLFFNYF